MEYTFDVAVANAVNRARLREVMRQLLIEGPAALAKNRYQAAGNQEMPFANLSEKKTGRLGRGSKAKDVGRE